MSQDAPSTQHDMLEWARSWKTAKHGYKADVLRKAAKHFGVSCPTMYRQFNQLVVPIPRKLRSDAGRSALTRAEAIIIVEAFKQYRESNADKPALSTAKVVEQLRRNGLIQAERWDKKTGQFIPLATSSILRGLRGYKLHLEPEEKRKKVPPVAVTALLSLDESEMLDDYRAIHSAIRRSFKTALREATSRAAAQATGAHPPSRSRRTG